MDTATLEKLLEKDIEDETRFPLMILASAGTPTLGHVDGLTRIQEIGQKRSVWVHVDGPSLAALSLVSNTNNVVSEISPLCGFWYHFCR